MYDKPIPSHNGFSWEKVKNVKIIESGEALVPLSLIPEKLLVRPQYYLQQIEGALPECFIREGSLSRLINVAERLPAGHKLLIFDAWRSEKVQVSLFNEYHQELKNKMPDKDEEELIDLTKEFVALPSSDQGSPSPHLTGGAVDLTIVDDKGRMLNMGTAFDDTTDKSYTGYYEELAKNKKLTEEEKTILYNRRLLYHLMSDEGFTNYPPEWWHFDYGNQNWAWIKSEGQYAIYGNTSPKLRWISRAISV